MKVEGQGSGSRAGSLELTLTLLQLRRCRLMFANSRDPSGEVVHLFFTLVKPLEGSFRVVPKFPLSGLSFCDRGVFPTEREHRAFPPLAAVRQCEGPVFLSSAPAASLIEALVRVFSAMATGGFDFGAAGSNEANSFDFEAEEVIKMQADAGNHAGGLLPMLLHLDSLDANTKVMGECGELPRAAAEGHSGGHVACDHGERLQGRPRVPAQGGYAAPAGHNGAQHL